MHRAVKLVMPQLSRTKRHNSVRKLIHPRGGKSFFVYWERDSRKGGWKLGKHFYCEHRAVIRVILKQSCCSKSVGMSKRSCRVVVTPKCGVPWCTAEEVKLDAASHISTPAISQAHLQIFYYQAEIFYYQAEIFYYQTASYPWPPTRLPTCP